MFYFTYLFEFAEPAEPGRDPPVARLSVPISALFIRLNGHFAGWWLFCRLQFITPQK